MDIPLECFITIDLINKTKIYTIKVEFLHILEYLVTNLLLMHEIDKMWKIENNKVKSHTIHKITQNIFSGKPLWEET